jgi:hypothetical protein
VLAIIRCLSASQTAIGSRIHASGMAVAYITQFASSE